MDKKKPDNLVDNLSAPRNYTPNSASPAAQEKDVAQLKTKIEEFKKKATKKFPFIKSISILSSQGCVMFEEEENIPKEIADTKPTHVMILIPEEQYKNLATIKKEILEYIKETKENLWVHIKTAEVDLWSYGLDSKFELLDVIATSYPIFDDGILGALRIAVIHKNLILNWLNVGRVRYVATYAIGGSLVRGTADKTSDVDTFVIIDDTDVKRMSRVELLEKLRGRITYDFIKEATALAGVKNILNVQVYLLTDFWQSVKDAQPVMFTFIRDGIPLYDRGTFIPWKRLLQMGRIKPSPESIDLYMKEGDRTDDLVKRRLLDCMVDVYYGVVTPTQAMMMLAGYAPPVPKTMVSEVKEALVEKEKVMTLNDLKTLEKAVKHFKDYEHGKLKEISGKEIDSLMAECKQYTKRIKEIRSKLEKKLQEEQAEKIYEETFALMKKIFGNKNIDSLIKDLETELIKTGKVPERLLNNAKELAKIKQKTKGKSLTQSEMQRYVRDAADLVNSLTEYTQRKEFVSVQRGVAHLLFKDKKAEIISTDKGIFVVESTGKLFKISHDKKTLTETDRQEFEKALAETKERLKFDLPAEILEIIRKELGDFSIGF